MRTILCMPTPDNKTKIVAKSIQGNEFGFDIKIIQQQCVLFNIYASTCLLFLFVVVVFLYFNYLRRICAK